MTTELYRRRTHEFYERYHVGDPAAVVEILAPEWRNHPRRLGEPEGPEGFMQVVAGLTGALPDLAFTVEEVLHDGDRVVARVVGHGTHTGGAFGPPSGRAVAFRSIDVHRFRPDGLIAESWHAEDVFGLLAQIGAVPNVYGARLDPYPGWE